MTALSLRLNTPIIIQRKGAGRDAFNQAIGDWEFYTDEMAAIEDLNTRELIAADGAGSAINKKFRIRYRDDLTTQMRVIEGGTAYNIVGLLDPKRNRRELLLVCTTLGAQA